MEIKSMFSKTALKVRKHAPDILVYGGVAGVVAASGMLISATMEAKPYINELKLSLYDIEHKRNELSHEEYSFRDLNKDVTEALNESLPKIAKYYILPVTTMALSLASIVTGYKILDKRYVATMGAYSALSTSYKAYRKRVSEKIGEKKEEELYRNVETVTDKENSDKSVKVIRSDDFSEYAKWFDETSMYFENDPTINLNFLRLTEKAMNDKLMLEGHLFLNEVYDALGLPRTSTGAVVGWLKDNEDGDGYVDFGIYDANRETTRDFVNGYEKRILLDFNVDGLMWNLI